MEEERRQLSGGDDDEEEDLHVPENELEALTVAARKKWTQLKANFQFGPKPKELSPEEKKLAELADIVMHHRHVDQDNVDDAVILPWYDRPFFDIVISLVIIFNTIIIGLELDAEHGSTDGRDWGWIFIEVIFMLIFMSECCIKINYHTWRWIFMDGWNFFTMAIATMAVVDGVILQAIGLHGNLRMLSLLRVIGIMRLLRVIRTQRMLKELLLVIQGLIGSLCMLSWTCIVLVVFLYVSAVFLTSSIGRADSYDDFKKLTNGWDHDDLFGSVGRSMYTLWQCLTRDGWSSSVARFVIVQQWYMALFFLLFMLLSTYGLLNLVVSIIVEQTLTAARNNASRMQAKEEQNQRAELEGLEEIFALVDTDGGGELDITEFRTALKDDRIYMKMLSLGLPIDDAARLFTVIDGEGTRTLKQKEFIDGCTKLKGAARSRDLLAITAQADTLSQKMDDLSGQLQDCEKMLYSLDEISVRIIDRFNPAIKSSRKKRAKEIAGSAPVVPIHPEKIGTAIGVDLGVGNRGLLPKFPNLLN